jgi:hypothetical protein
MRELTQTELNEIQGGALAEAILTGAAATFVGWVVIIYNKDVLYQILKIENVALVGSLGAIVGGLSYFVGTMV